MELEMISIVLILIGIALLVAEIFIPSFGVSGGLGIVAIVAGIILTADSINQGIIMFLVILVIVLILMFVAYKFMSTKKSPLVLDEILKEDEGDKELAFFLNRVGIALTILRPSGKADFDGVRLDVMSEGDFIKKGQKVVVTRTEGKKIFVREVVLEGENHE